MNNNIKNQWQFLKNYINIRDIGYVILRRQLMECVYGGNRPETAIDLYIRCLRKIGILETLAPGEYEIKAHIKGSTTSSEIRKVAYSDSYRQWFHDIIVKETC